MQRFESSSVKPSVVWLLAVMALTAAVLWAGIGGPLIFDDYHNLNPIKAWLAGDSTWDEVMFGNRSGRLGRSVSMATLMLNAAIGGTDGVAYKVGNILLHLLCGGLVFWLVRDIQRLDPRTAPRAALGATVVAAIWLLNPAVVSTVLYAVQRMAQVSTFFVLAALVAFVRGMALWGVRPTAARVLIGLVCPSLVFVGVFGKENAVVAPLMAMGLVAAFPQTAFGRVRLVRVVCWTLFALGLLAFVYILVMKPSFFVGGYAKRDFTLEQRLYTQLIAMVDYVRLAFVPAGATSGLFADDYPLSSGLLSPPRTLVSLLILLGITAGAVALRHRMPMVLAGWLMFLAGHAIESSVFALELYFEHRNYLPSVGLYLAGWGLIAALVDWLRNEMPHMLRMAWFVLALYAAIMVFATWQRAQVWGNELVLFALTAEARPDSYRANAGLWDVALRNEQYELARAAVDRLVVSKRDRSRALGHIHRLVLDCMTTGAGDPADLESAVEAFPGRLIDHDLYITKELVHTVIQRCGRPAPVQIAGAIEAISLKDLAPLRRGAVKAQFQILAALAYMHADDLQQALRLTGQAWALSKSLDAGVVRAEVLVSAGYPEEAANQLSDVERMYPWARDNAYVVKLRSRLQSTIVEPQGNR